MTSETLRIRKLQRRVASLLTHLFKMADARDVKETTPAGWVLTWNPSKPDTVYIDDEKDGSWSDSALRYPNGKIVYDAPENIPGAVKDAVKKFFVKVRRHKTS